MRRLAVWAALAWSTAIGAQQPESVDRAIDAAMARQDANQRSQTRIDALDDASREALQRYRAASWQRQQLDAYGEQLQQLLETQAQEKASLQSQLDELKLTAREILPLMLRMLDGLERFVAEDLPFLREEREARIDGLRRTFADPSATLADKFARLIEAYRIEYDYGRALGAERSVLSDSGAVVDLLRVGRTALYYRRLDGTEVGYWDAAGERWIVLPNRYEGEIREGLRIARETAAASLLVLPVAAPGAQP